MSVDALLAYCHYVAILATVGVVMAEYLLCRPPVELRAITRLGWTDFAYMFTALAVIGSGLGRAVWGAKTWAFYSPNPLFWLKIGVASLGALFSVVPTVRFLQWAKAARADAGFVVADAAVTATRRWIVAELVVFVVMPLLAVLIARGIGL